MVKPLGHRNPLLPSTALGLGQYQPNLQFLIPLGSQKLTVLNPSLFRKGALGSEIPGILDPLGPMTDRIDQSAPLHDVLGSSSSDNSLIQTKSSIPGRRDDDQGQSRSEHRHQLPGDTGDSSTDQSITAHRQPLNNSGITTPLGLHQTAPDWRSPSTTGETQRSSSPNEVALEAITEITPSEARLSEATSSEVIPDAPSEKKPTGRLPSTATKDSSPPITATNRQDIQRRSRNLLDSNQSEQPDLAQPAPVQPETSLTEPTLDLANVDSTLDDDSVPLTASTSTPHTVSGGMPTELEWRSPSATNEPTPEPSPNVPFASRVNSETFATIEPAPEPSPPLNDIPLDAVTEASPSLNDTPLRGITGLPADGSADHPADIATEIFPSETTPHQLSEKTTENPTSEVADELSSAITAIDRQPIQRRSNNLPDALHLERPDQSVPEASLAEPESNIDESRRTDDTSDSLASSPLTSEASVESNTSTNTGMGMDESDLGHNFPNPTVQETSLKANSEEIPLIHPKSKLSTPIQDSFQKPFSNLSESEIELGIFESEKRSQKHQASLDRGASASSEFESSFDKKDLHLPTLPKVIKPIGILKPLQTSLGQTILGQEALGQKALSQTALEQTIPTQTLQDPIEKSLLQAGQKIDSSIVEASYQPIASAQMGQFFDHNLQNTSKTVSSNILSASSDAFPASVLNASSSSENATPSSRLAQTIESSMIKAQAISNGWQSLTDQASLLQDDPFSKTVVPQPMPTPSTVMSSPLARPSQPDASNLAITSSDLSPLQTPKAVSSQQSHAIAPSLEPYPYPNLHPLRSKLDDLKEALPTPSTIPGADHLPDRPDTAPKENVASKAIAAPDAFDKLASHIYQLIRQRLIASQERRGHYSRRLG